MKKWIKNLVVSLLLIGVMAEGGFALMTTKAAVNSEKIVAAAKKKKTGVRFKKSLVKDLNKTYGQVKKEQGGKLEAEFLYHGEFEADVDKLDVDYVFIDNDPEADYELTDKTKLLKISGDMDDFVSGFKKKMSVKSFMSQFKKGLFSVKYKVEEGEANSYYVSDRYLNITFKVKKNDKKIYRIQTAVSEKNEVEPDSLTWLTMK